MTALSFQLRASKVPYALGIDAIDNLAEMFFLIELFWSVVLGAIGAIITVLCVKMWENSGAPDLRENRGLVENVRSLVIFLK